MAVKWRIKLEVKIKAIIVVNTDISDDFAWLAWS
jgi:hypothetical protein